MTGDQASREGREECCSVLSCTGLSPTLALPSTQRPGRLFNSSHATLLVGRRGDEKKAHLELRHQRTPDVIISPALPAGACPDAGEQAGLLPAARCSCPSA